MNQIDYRDPEWVAERLGVDKNTVYKHLQDGTIPAVQLGRKWLISEARLIEWLESEMQKQTRERRESAAGTEFVVRRLTNYSVRTRDLLRRAHAEARRYGHRDMGQEHLLLAMAADPECAAFGIMKRGGIDEEKLREAIEKRCPPVDKVPPRRLARSTSAKKAMRLATEEAKQGQSPLVQSQHLLLGILVAGEGTGFEILGEMGLSADAVRSQMKGFGADSET